MLGEASPEASKAGHGPAHRQAGDSLAPHCEGLPGEDNFKTARGLETLDYGLVGVTFVQRHMTQGESEDLLEKALSLRLLEV